MSNPKSSTTVEEASTALQRIELDPQALIQSAIAKGSDVETLERLFALAKDVQAVRARQAWYSAMAEFQKACPKIRKSERARINTRSGGSYEYSYAPLEEIMSAILPVMGPLGLSVSYRVKHEATRVIAVCRVSHEMGHHEESGEVAMPVVQESATGSGAMGANPAQRVGIATTYAKRYALLAIVGLAPEDDGDAETGPRVAQPRRASEAAPAHEAEARTVNHWTGKVLKVAKSKSGKRQDGKEWTLYTITTADAQEFVTFSESDADFARKAGNSPVTIEWEKTDRGSLKVVSIGPAAEREPGDEAPDA